MQTSTQHLNREPPTRYTAVKLSGTSGHHIHQIMHLLRDNGFESVSKPKWNKYPEQQHGHIYTVYLKVPISKNEQPITEQVVETIC